MGLYPWQYITKPPFQFAGISIRNLAPLISPISTLGPPLGAAAQKVANAKTAAISLVMEPPGFKRSIAGERIQNSGARIQKSESASGFPSGFWILDSFSIAAKTPPTPAPAPS